MEANKLSTLNITEYNLIATKDPSGNYDRRTRENLYWVIEKLRANAHRLSALEYKIYSKFREAQFGALGEKEKRVKFEIARYRLSNNAKQALKMTMAGLLVFIVTSLAVYQFILDAAAQQNVQVAYYAGLNKVGLVSKENFEQIKKDLNVTSTELEKTKQEFQELNLMIEEMIRNNRVTENLKYIIKQIYNDPRAEYVTDNGSVSFYFNRNKIATYKSDPELWYLLGIIETGVMRVYYNNEEILEFRSIFGRKGEETPLGEYKIKNKIPKPTWYKKEELDGKTRVRAIPFGDPDHEIGLWWMGLNKIGDPVPGSYGIHGVNVSKVNEFYKKNFDWRSGSAGCPNVQEWYLDFLAKVVPAGANVNIVAKDKWANAAPFVPPSSA